MQICARKNGAFVFHHCERVCTFGAFFKLPQLSGRRTGELILKRGVATLARRPLKHFFPCNPARFRGGKDQPRWEGLARELCVCEKQKKNQCFRAQFIAQTIARALHPLRQSARTRFGFGSLATSAGEEFIGVASATNRTEQKKPQAQNETRSHLHEPYGDVSLSSRFPSFNQRGALLPVRHHCPGCPGSGSRVACCLFVPLVFFLRYIVKNSKLFANTVRTHNTVRTKIPNALPVVVWRWPGSMLREAPDSLNLPLASGGRPGEGMELFQNSLARTREPPNKTKQRTQQTPESAV